MGNDNGKGVGIRVAGAAIGGVVGGVGAYLNLPWLTPSNSLGLVVFLAAAGAVLGLFVAMNVELYRQR